MKRILLTITAVCLVAVACGNNGKKADNACTNTDSPAAATETQNENNMKTLVAYFSATGTTEALAKQLAEVTGGTLYEIKPEVPYTSADLDWTDKKSRSTIEMQDPNSRPAIVKDLEDADAYGTVFIGFPVWWYTAPTIINTFLESYDFSGRTVVFFATSGGSNINKANKQFREQYEALDWKDGKVLNRATKADVEAWVKSLGL